jgi:hypothetical protein
LILLGLSITVALSVAAFAVAAWKVVCNWSPRHSEFGMLSIWRSRIDSIEQEIQKLLEFSELLAQRINGSDESVFPELREIRTSLRDIKQGGQEIGGSIGGYNAKFAELNGLIAELRKSTTQSLESLTSHVDGRIDGLCREIQLSIESVGAQKSAILHQVRNETSQALAKTEGALNDTLCRELQLSIKSIEAQKSEVLHHVRNETSQALAKTEGALIDMRGEMQISIKSVEAQNIEIARFLELVRSETLQALAQTEGALTDLRSQIATNAVIQRIERAVAITRNGVHQKERHPPEEDIATPESSPIVEPQPTSGRLLHRDFLPLTMLDAAEPVGSDRASRVVEQLGDPARRAR